MSHGSAEGNTKKAQSRNAAAGTCSWLLGKHNRVVKSLFDLGPIQRSRRGGESHSNLHEQFWI